MAEGLLRGPLCGQIRGVGFQIACRGFLIAREDFDLQSSGLIPRTEPGTRDLPDGGPPERDHLLAKVAKTAEKRGSDLIW